METRYLMWAGRLEAKSQRCSSESKWGNLMTENWLNPITLVGIESMSPFLKLLWWLIKLMSKLTRKAWSTSSMSKIISHRISLIWQSKDKSLRFIGDKVRKKELPTSISSNHPQMRNSQRIEVGNWRSFQGSFTVLPLDRWVLGWETANYPFHL